MSDELKRSNCARFAGVSILLTIGARTSHIRANDCSTTVARMRFWCSIKRRVFEWTRTSAAYCCSEKAAQSSHTLSGCGLCTGDCSLMPVRSMCAVRTVSFLVTARSRADFTADHREGVSTAPVHSCPPPSRGVVVTAWSLAHAHSSR